MAAKKSTSKSKVTKTTSKAKVESAPAPSQGEAVQYDNTNRGVLFPNDKQGNESRPDYTGKINVDGVEKRLAAWVTESKSGSVSQFLKIIVSDFQNPNA